MRRYLAAAAITALGVIVIGAALLLTAAAIVNPLFRRDLQQLPREAAKWTRRTANDLVRWVELAGRPDVIEPERRRFSLYPAEFDFTLYRYVQTYPWITDGASLTFRFPRGYVLTNMVSGSGAVPTVPIQFDADTLRPLACMPNCRRDVGAHLSLPQTYVPMPPRPEDFSNAFPLPNGELPREQKGGTLFVAEAIRRDQGWSRDTLFRVGEEHCGFALYETADQRDANLPYPFDRARIFRREAGSDPLGRTVVCHIDTSHGTCETADEYELGLKIYVSFPHAMLCEADEVMKHARKIFDDHLIKRTEAVPGWGRRVKN